MPQNTEIKIDAQENKLRKAQDAYQLGDLDTAEKLASSIVQEMYKSPGAHILMGLIKLQKGSADEAIDYFNKSIALEPTTEAYNNLGVTYRKLKKYDKAINAFKKAIESLSPRADVYYNLANTYKDIGKNDKAIEAYKIAIKLNPKFTSAYNNLATLYQETGDIKKAIETIQQGLSHDPENTSLLYNMGITYQLEKKYKEAREYFLKTLQKKPNWLECINNLGIVEQAIGLSDEAIERFKHILKENSNHAPAINNLASILAKKGQYNQALRLFIKALKNNPANHTAAHNIVHLLKQHSSFFDAEKELSILSIEFPDNTTIKLAYAQVLFDSKQYEKAKKILHEIENSGEKNAEVDKLLGIIAFIEKKEKEAGEYFSRYKTEKHDTHYQLDIIKLLKEQGDYKNAVIRLREYLQENPSDKEAKILYAEISMEQGNIDEAFSIMKEAEEEHKDDSQVLTTLARIYQKSGQKEKAIETIDNIISIQSSRGTPEDISNLNESLSLYEETIKAFQEGKNWEENLKKISDFSQAEEEWEIDLSIPEMDDGAKLLNFEEHFTKDGEASLFEESQEEETEEEEKKEIPALEKQFTSASSPSLLDLPDESLRRPQQPIFIAAPTQAAPQTPPPAPASQAPMRQPSYSSPQPPVAPPPAPQSPQPTYPQQAAYTPPPPAQTPPPPSPQPAYTPPAQQPPAPAYPQQPASPYPPPAPQQASYPTEQAPPVQRPYPQNTAPPRPPYPAQANLQEQPEAQSTWQEQEENPPYPAPDAEALADADNIAEEQVSTDETPSQEEDTTPQEAETDLTEDTDKQEETEENTVEELQEELPISDADTDTDTESLAKDHDQQNTEPSPEAEPQEEEQDYELQPAQTETPQHHPNIPLEHMPEYADLEQAEQPSIPIEELPEYADLHESPRAEAPQPETPQPAESRLPSPQEQAALLSYLENLANYLPEPRKQELKKSNYKTKLDKIKEKLLSAGNNPAQPKKPAPPANIQEMGQRMEKLLTAIKDFRSKNT